MYSLNFLTDPHNRYKNYTIIHVLYCSGDVHAGNITRDYNDNPGPQGEPVEQMGYFNAKVSGSWLQHWEGNRNMC